MNNSNTDNTDSYIPPITDKPYLLPLVGLLAGIAIWLLDAFIDVYVLDEEQTIIENIFTPELTELWMRSLVTFILITMGIFSRKSIQKHIELDNILINHKNELEKLVIERTEELSRKTEEMIILANQDPLTGLSNRRKFNESLLQEYNRFTRHKVPFTLIMIDIDYFKKVNDTYGHDVGDQVIIKLSSTVKNNIRKTDELARWGGEEFILLAIETDENGYKVLAENTYNVIKEIEYDKLDKITASIGVTCSQEGDELEDILKRADNALYQAKDNGRDRIEYL